MWKLQIEELGATARVWAPEALEPATIPATLWGSAGAIEVDPRELVEGGPSELCITFCAEGGYAGGRIRVSDLLAAIAQHHPQLLRKALALPPTTVADTE